MKVWVAIATHADGDTEPLAVVGETKEAAENALSDALDEHCADDDDGGDNRDNWIENEAIELPVILA